MRWLTNSYKAAVKVENCASLALLIIPPRETEREMAQLVVPGATGKKVRNTRLGRLRRGDKRSRSPKS